MKKRLVTSIAALTLVLAVFTASASAITPGNGWMGPRYGNWIGTCQVDNIAPSFVNSTLGYAYDSYYDCVVPGKSFNSDVRVCPQYSIDTIHWNFISGNTCHDSGWHYVPYGTLVDVGTTYPGYPGVYYRIWSEAWATIYGVQYHAAFVGGWCRYPTAC